MRYLMICPFLFLAVLLSASEPSIFDALSATPTHYKITINDSPLVVTSQGITQRAVTDEIRAKNADGDEVVNHVAYRAYHLEFAYELKFIDKRGYGTVEFYQGTELLHVLSLSDPNRLITSTGKRRYEQNFLALNLEGVPVVMLDSIDRINFLKAK